MQISGKTVVITGGGRGIGRELAKAFAAKGGTHCKALYILNNLQVSLLSKRYLIDLQNNTYQ